MQNINRDILSVVYNYCNIDDLRALSSTCKRNYLAADDRYYQQRIKLFFYLSTSELDENCLQKILSKLNEIHDKAILGVIKKVELNDANIDHYARILLYEKLKILFINLPLFLRHIEKKSMLLFKFFLESARVCPLVKKINAGITYNHFRHICDKKNKRLPIIISNNLDNFKVNCELSKDLAVEIFDLLRPKGFTYYVIKRDNKLFPSLVRNNNFEVDFYDCLEFFEIKSVTEFSMLYFNIFKLFHINNRTFVRGEMENGKYHAYFEFYDINNNDNDEDIIKRFAEPGVKCLTKEELLIAENQELEHSSPASSSEE